MAFFFGKKDKNPPEAAAPVEKAPLAPPKLQTPPSTATPPPVKPPQPSGLVPASNMPAGAATTQPMVMPRAPSSTGLKPSRAGAPSTRSTQRIVLPSSAPGKNVTKTLGMGAPTGRVNLPIGMILRCLPPEVLAADISEFEASGAAATEIGLPMNLILNQLPSGKVEIPLQELVPFFPSGFLQPTESISNYLSHLVNLPLMDVVMRIPPDLLALRPDQKDVDSAVINMADPFTEEILREQAEAARRQSQPNIIEESQAPQEEFVPQDQAAPAKPLISPQRAVTGSLSAPPAQPPPHSPPPIDSGAPSPFPQPAMKNTIPPATTGPVSMAARTGAPMPPPSPQLASRTISASGRLVSPTRATTSLPGRITMPSSSAAQPPANNVAPEAHAPEGAPPPMPPVAQSLRPSVPIPPVSRTSGLPPVSQIAPQPPLVLEAPEVTEPEPPPVAAEPLPQAAPPAGNAEDLQRLAALAMAQLGDDGTTESGSVATEVADLNTEAPVAEAVRTQVIQQPVAEAPVAEAPALEEPAVDQSVTEGPTTENLITQEPVPEAKVFRPLDFSKTVSMPPPVPTMTLAPTTTTGSLAKPEAPAPAAAPVVPEPEPEAPEPVKAPPMPEAAPVAAAPAVAEIPAANAEPEAVQEPAMAEAAEEDGSATGSIAFNLNSCTVEELRQIPGCFPELAESIVRYREKIGSFRSLEDLLDVPGMTKAAYTNLTGEIPPENRIPLSLNELLGFPPEQATSLKDVTDRIACWPDVTGCLLSQSSGLSLVGTAPQGLSKEAIVAFVPRMFEAINKSFSEIMGRETDDLVIPTSGTSFHIFRNKDLYLVILSRLPQMPERHMKVARFVLAALSVRRDY